MRMVEEVFGSLAITIQAHGGMTKRSVFVRAGVMKGIERLAMQNIAARAFMQTGKRCSNGLFVRDQWRFVDEAGDFAVENKIVVSFCANAFVKRLFLLTFYLKELIAVPILIWIHFWKEIKRFGRKTKSE